jgi:hypothetical protein
MGSALKPIKKVVGYSCNVCVEPVYPTGWSQPGDRDDHLSPLVVCGASSSTMTASYLVGMKHPQLGTSSTSLRSMAQISGIFSFGALQSGCARQPIALAVALDVRGSLWSPLTSNSTKRPLGSRLPHSGALFSGSITIFLKTFKNNIPFCKCTIFSFSTHRLCP